MTRSIKNPNRPKTNSEGIAVRHIPHTVYDTVPVDALLKYLYKYNFHVFCTEFKVKNGSEVKVFKSSKYKGPSIIFETLEYLVAQSSWYDQSENLICNGLAIKESGFKCIYNTKDLEDPYFKVLIDLDPEHELPEKITVKANEVVNVSK